MKVAVLAVLLVATCATAQPTAEPISNTGARSDLPGIAVNRNRLGTGTRTPMITVGTETAIYVDDGYYHLPQYLPSYPTAGVIWPRVVEVECEEVDAKVVCSGYSWAPRLGRGEYIMIVPRMKPAPEPKSTPTVITVPPVIIYREVPPKRKAE